LANPELGAKQICPNCQSKFYDLGRRPATCPKCATVFDPEEAVRNRRIRARAAPADYDNDEEKPEKAAEVEVEGFEDEADETPELDQVTEAEPLETDDDSVDAPAAPAEELGVDFAEEGDLEEEVDDAVPFLEDEDEDDFVDEEIDGLPGEDDT
jgi:uncharacterized protein (TIGR02300 family)